MSCLSATVALVVYSGCHDRSQNGSAAAPSVSARMLEDANSDAAMKGEEILHPDNSLSGIKSIGVVVTMQGSNQIAESILESAVASRLKEAGITVVPVGKEPRFPMLQLNVETKLWSNSFNPSILYSLTLGYYRLFPNFVPGRSEKYVMGMTWSQDRSGTVPVLQVEQIRGDATALTNAFLETVKRVNRK